MGETEGGEIAVLAGKVGKTVDDDRELLEEESEGFADEDQVRIAADTMSRLTAPVSKRMKGAYSVT